MAAKIDCYVDCVSPFSYFAFVYLSRNRRALEFHDVELEFHPVFLGGVNAATGNKPPGALPAKAKYSSFEIDRAKKQFKLPNVKRPATFPIVSLLPQRCMVYIKSTYSREKYEDAFREMWITFWEEGKDLSKPEFTAEALTRHFDSNTVKQIMDAANTPDYKQMLNDNTKKAVELGAFGCPWTWVKNKRGEEEPFFGSDRFRYIYDFLDIPRTDVAIVEASKL